MKARILRPEEWEEINTPDLPELLKYCNPDDVAVVVVEKDGRIVASVMVLKVTHFEGLWIKPEERGNAGVFRALIRQAYALPWTRGEQWALGGAADGDDGMDTLCSKLGGVELPMRFYAIPVG